jgi:ferritin
MKFFDYIYERNGQVELQTIQQPPREWSSPKHAMEEAYKHECYISERINQLVDLAMQEKDHATLNFLQWFVAEQVEEESTVLEIVQQLNMVEGNIGLLMIDRGLKNR